MQQRRQQQQGYVTYENPRGPRISTALDRVVEQDGLYFRDPAGCGQLLPYADWRLDADTRARDLASRMTVEQIAGLMLYSPHQMVPGMEQGPFTASYGGRPYSQAGVDPWALTDQQKEFVVKDHVRHVLMMRVESADAAARWNNEMQRLAEEQPLGIPINFSSDPRNGAQDGGAEFKSGGSDISRWPEGLGMAATFSPERCREYASIISREYRALGIATALSPQVDLSTEPRWMRLEDTFGPHPVMTTDFARAYCDGLQTTSGAAGGWGKESVLAMAKHWPGGGTGEGGRDAHYPFGQYAVYPGGNFQTHLRPFLEGAFRLDGPTRCAAAVMPYYTVSWQADAKNGKNVGNSYSEYLIKDLLREKYGYDGVVCTDWGITGDPSDEIDSFSNRCYGVEKLTEAQRHLLAIENGVDQFGGNCRSQPVLDAYALGCEKYGEEAMRARMERSAVRLLRGMFRCGLFDDPYLDPAASAAVVGCEEFCRAGYQAQLDSLVLLKNSGVLPLQGKKKVYIPLRHVKARKNFFRGMEPDREVDPVAAGLPGEYVERVDSPEEADLALVFIESPLTDGYSAQDRQQGGNGYLPLSLQYRPYTAAAARPVSIASGDFREPGMDRSYRGKTVYAANESDCDLVLDTKERMGDKPVIVVIRMHNPAVLAEFEAQADAMVVDFGVQTQAVLDLLWGRQQPAGRLPLDLPANMETVEQHCEDLPFDYAPYIDTAGHTYQFGYGLDWEGEIRDDKSRRYPRG